MKTLMTLVASLLAISLLCSNGITAQTPQTLTAGDRTEIQALVTGYARTLGSCDEEGYADLFAPGTGYFASGFRGHVTSRERLIAMVQSERQCTTQRSPTQPARPANGPTGPTVAINVTPAGIFGIADLGNAGHYEDQYVRTAKGWKFAARTVITPVEKTAGLNAEEMLAIRRLAGGPQDADDFWAPGQDGVKRFRSAGVVIGVSSGSVTGRVYLKDGGYYDDVYEKAAGHWRFKSRNYVAAAQTP